MKLKHTLLTLCVLASNLAQAIETDQFSAWTVDLKDSAPLVETYFMRHVDAVVDEANSRSYISNNCSSIAKEVSELLSQATNVPGITSIEKWLTNVEAIDRVPKKLISLHTSAGTIYGEYWRTRFVTFGSTLQLHGIRMGADKIGHFTEIGMSYYKKVQKLLKDGESYEKAVKSVIGYGIFLENNIYGLYTSRVFSYADLEANYQGLKFYEDLCRPGTHAHLAFDKVKRKWKFANRSKFTLKPYVNPNWDESYNISHYSPALHSMILPRIQKKCEQLEHPLVAARNLDYLKRIDRNMNQVYLEQLASKGRIVPKTFSNMQEYCASPATEVAFQ